MGQHEDNVRYLISRIDERSEFIRLEDGFLYYDPRPGCGAISAWALRAIADELDNRNAEWNSQIELYFSENGGAHETDLHLDSTDHTGNLLPDA